jgi:hypothetical protein
MYKKGKDYDEALDISTMLDGKLNPDTISWIRQNIPSIVEIHFTKLTPTETNPKKKNHITIVFDDCSRAHWWYKDSDTIIIPKPFSASKWHVNSEFRYSRNSIPVEGTNNSTITIPHYLLNLLYHNMKDHTEIYGDVRDITEYVGHLFSLRSEEELNEYGTNIEIECPDLIELDENKRKHEEPIDEYGSFINSRRKPNDFDYLRRDSDRDRDRDRDRDGGSKKIKKSHKRKLHKRKSHKKKSHKRKSYKRKSYKRK